MLLNILYSIIFFAFRTVNNSVLQPKLLDCVRPYLGIFKFWSTVGHQQLVAVMVQRPNDGHEPEGSPCTTYSIL